MFWRYSLRMNFKRIYVAVPVLPRTPGLCWRYQALWGQSSGRRSRRIWPMRDEDEEHWPITDEYYCHCQNSHCVSVNSLRTWHSSSMVLGCPVQWELWTAVISQSEHRKAWHLDNTPAPGIMSYVTLFKLPKKLSSFLTSLNHYVIYERLEIETCMPWDLWTMLSSSFQISIHWSL